MTTNYGERPGMEAQPAQGPRTMSDPSAPVAIGVCAHCHRDIMDTDATDETGTLHFEPCAGEAAAMVEDMLTDRAREAELVREWGGR